MMDLPERTIRWFKKRPGTLIAKDEFAKIVQTAYAREGRKITNDRITRCLRTLRADGVIEKVPIGKRKYAHYKLNGSGKTFKEREHENYLKDLAWFNSL